MATSKGRKRRKNDDLCNLAKAGYLYPIDKQTSQSAKKQTSMGRSNRSSERADKGRLIFRGSKWKGFVD